MSLKAMQKSSKENNIKHFSNEKYDAEHDSSSEHFGIYVDIYMWYLIKIIYIDDYAIYDAAVIPNDYPEYNDDEESKESRENKGITNNLMMKFCLIYTLLDVVTTLKNVCSLVVICHNTHANYTFCKHGDVVSQW